MNRFLCPDCVMDFQAVRSPLCCGCGAVFADCDGNDHFCENCVRSPRHFHQARAAGIYQGALRQMIQDFKFHGRIHLAGPFGLLMLHVLNRMYAEKAEDPSVPGMIVPVPLHARRLRSRGFNQAFLLSEHLVKLNRQQPAPKLPFLKTEKDVLLRSRWTHPQTGLTRDMRQTNIAGAFQVKAPGKALGKHILLIDDVYTTGSTVDECARILVRAGAARVDVLTLARV